MGFWRTFGKAAAALRPKRVKDDVVARRVRIELERIAGQPSAIQIAVEHGCVELRGPVETHERARIVREVARLRGVDAVVDLMTEPAA